MQRLVIASIVAVVLTSLLITAGVKTRPTSAQAESALERGASGSLEPLWDAPDFRYVDQHGRTTTRAPFAGDVWVASFIFTQCRTVCPLLSCERMYETSSGVGIARGSVLSG
jgi:cytochrome oxidase Cu insertion factor (SCO1/SenC/PrrC family)